MNKIYLTGRISHEPECRKTQSGIDVCNFSLAVDKPGARKDDQLPPDFFDCVVWGGKEGPGRAGVISKYFHKGDGIVLSGSMQSNKYTDKQGNNRIGWQVRVDDFEFPMGRKSGENGQQSGQTAPEGTKPDGTFVEVESSELPF